MKIIQTTLPSKKISTVDVAEIEQFKTEFIYNFFQKDERVNDTGQSVPNRIQSINSTDLPVDIQSNIDLNTRVPRYVTLTWKPYVVGNRPDISTNIKIKNNIEKVYFEDNFSYDDFSVIEVQDLSIQKKLNLFINTLLKTSNTDSKSASKMLKQTTETTNVSVRPELISNGLANNLYGIRYFNENNKEKESNSFASLLKLVKANVQLNNKILGDAVRFGAYSDPSNPFADEYQGFLSEADSLQKKARQYRDSSRISSEEYDFEIDKFVTQKTLFSDVHDPFIQTVGYIIEKIEIREDGSEKRHKNLFVENPNKGVYLDFKVKYGSSYVYKIRSVFYVEVEGIDEVSGLLSSLGILVASRPTASNVLDCVEFTPPPPPQDLSFQYKPLEGGLKISWTFPVNPQRDIKKFQVFKRFSVNEPYELMKEYDFDDSEVKAISGEFPEEYLVEKLSGPKTTYFDHEFNRTNTAFYCLASVDAHGISSNYSSQFRLKFNNILNKLVVEPISIVGAPKAYPNLWVNQDAFVDSIRDQYHSKISVYFNPEYLKVFDKDDKDLNLLAIKASDSYQIQLINIDLNQQQLLKIKLNDRTENVIREPIDGAINRTLLKQKLDTERLKDIDFDEQRQNSGYIDKKIDSIFKAQ